MKPFLRSLVILVVSLIVTSCGSNDDHGHAHGADADHSHDGEAATLVFTDYTESTELFVEFPALVVGRGSTFAAHVTRLSDFEPLTSGQVDVLLETNGTTVARFRVREPARSGIFSPVVQPRDAGAFDLVLEVRDGPLSARHELGSVTVFANASSVVVNQPEGEGDIGYLKEQQWSNPFATMIAAERPLRRSVPGFGTVLAPADAGAEIRAPAEGYFAATQIAPAGTTVAANDVLGYLVPRLGEGTDFGSLLVALERAQAEHALVQHDVERFVDLFSKGAIPERRLIEARRRATVTGAELAAARSRVEQYQRGDQRAGIALRAPVPGSVIEANVRPGAYVQSGDRLFRIASPERRWLEIRVPERYADALPSASGAWLGVSGKGTVVLDTESHARVVQIGSAIDPVTRSASVVIEYPANAGPASVGSRHAASVFVTDAEYRLAVPRSALVEDEGRTVVYVQTGGEIFVRRAVEPGIVDGRFVEVLSGLKADERVVSKGAYLVRLAAAGGDDIGHGHAH